MPAVMQTKLFTILLIIKSYTSTSWCGRAHHPTVSCTSTPMWDSFTTDINYKNKQINCILQTRTVTEKKHERNSCLSSAMRSFCKSRRIPYTVSPSVVTTRRKPVRGYKLRSPAFPREKRQKKTTHPGQGHAMTLWTPGTFV